MNDSRPTIQIATAIGLFAVAIAVTMNTCAMDRLEDQVIATRKAVESGVSMGGSTMAAQAPRPMGSEVKPGDGTGLMVVGWGGARGEITHVEGAVDNAPLQISDKPKPQNDQYVNRRFNPPGSLNYFATNEGEANTVARYSLDRLIEVDPHAPPAVIPSLATSWEVSDDKLTYTYHLRKGVKFADGRDFTSADVKFSFDVVRDPEVTAQHLRAVVEEVASVTTPDDHTVVVQYRKKDFSGLFALGYFLRVMNAGWVQEQIPKYAKKLDIEEFSVTPGSPGFGEVFNKIRIPIPGSGPYFFVGDTFEPEHGIELAQNPFSWRTQVHPTWYNFTKLRWVFISDTVAAFEEFRKETFDVSVVPHQAWHDEFKNDPTIQDISNYYVYDHMGLGQSAITWNARKPPFDDARVRRAMTMLIDRWWIKDEVERGTGDMAICGSKPIYPSYPHHLKPHPFDPEAAVALLAEAGWTDSDGDGILDKDGQRFEFEIKMGASLPFYNQVAGLFEDSLKKVGIRMTPRTLEWATFIEDYYERRFDGALLFHSHSGPWIDFYSEYHSSQDVPRGGNAVGWHNDEADKIMELAREEFDEKKRDKLSHRFCEIFHDEQPRTLLHHGHVGVLQNKRFEDVEVLPTGLRIYEYWVKPENVLHK